jgi:hypothetical protein
MAARRHVFVLRIWTEEEQVGDSPLLLPALRGSIQTVDAQQVHYFTSLQKALALLEGMIGEQGDRMIR